ncbi:MAG: hypothetical protein Ct9H300mP8_11680 [Gammaproteobacteria bacterium]|nr:MAG: hypothetical protein Ct9H300mP8_11680 [Gammaproteobacteria bacterium]
MLREVVQPRRALAPLLVSRIKVMAKLESRKTDTQDGRIPLRIGGREIDLRCHSTHGNGERVVLRFLDKEAGRLELQKLGMDATTLRGYRGLSPNHTVSSWSRVRQDRGKTTTLYASLAN